MHLCDKKVNVCCAVDEREVRVGSESLLKVYLVLGPDM